MADKKISELDAITGAATAADDFFIVVDSSGSATKKISREELNNAIERDVLSTVDIDGGTIDGTTIGGSSAAAGTFTDLTVTGTVTGISTGISNVVEDTTPQLGGTLDANGQIIDMGVNTITDTKVGQWDTAYGWGDHSTAGYLTSETFTEVSQDTTPQLGGNLDTNGNDITFGDDDKAIFGSAADGIQIYNTAAGDKFISEAGGGNLKVQGDNLYFQNSAGTENYIIAISNAAVTLHYDSAAKLATTSGGINVTGEVQADSIVMNDSETIYLGNSADLRIYHDGTHSYVQDIGSGSLILSTNGTSVSINTDGPENMGVFNKDGSVDLYYNNSKKFETTSYGVDISGSAVADTQTTNATGATTANFDSYQNFVWTLTGNVTLSNPTTEKVGQSGFFVFIQDATGGRTVSLGTDYETAGGSGLTLSSAASTTDIVPYVVAASGRILLGAPQLNFS